MEVIFDFWNFFFYFIFLISEQDFLLEVGFFLLQSWGRLARVSNFGAGQKTKIQLITLLSGTEIWNSCCTVWFFVVPGSVQYAEISVQLFWRWEAPQKNNANTTECVGSSESKCVVFWFVCTYFLIAFLGADASLVFK